MMSKPFSELSVAEKWLWHSNVYAFRRIVLGVPREETVSPCDQTGVWFDESMVAEAEKRLLEKRGAHRRRRVPLLDNPAELANLDRLKRLQDELEVQRGRRAGNIGRHAAATLGVRIVREYTPEEMRAGRIALGLEEPPKTEAAE